MSDPQWTNRLVHLVGSVPLNTAADVFRAVSEAIGPHLKRIPDGETGDRTGWVGFQALMLLDHPSFELVPSAVPGERAEDLARSVRAQADGYRTPSFRLREGVDPTQLRFTRLGYTEAALASYATFAEFKASGVLHPGIRFQVALPTPLAPLAIFVTPADIPAVLPAYQTALLRELAEICAAIPAGELAVQWDVAVEMGLLEGAFPAPFDNVDETVAAGMVALGDAVPSGVSLGYHLCYGDMGLHHFIEPRDMSVLVGLANRISAGLTRSLDWMHMPVPRDRDDPGYFEPLERLRLAETTELFLGLVHDSDGLEGARRRMTSAAKFRSGFGVGTECGFGRRDPRGIPALLQLHREVAISAEPLAPVAVPSGEQAER
ncbi:MAG: hypothetical protein QOC75_250 [Pseudonocardiales bacterium]|jgi:hypothetical protein|nr:hypothetical protein [Pseudonocardiales bacterium]MDT7671162.1 hypothetical protein [Pseudonocardiales bacterium]